MTRYHLNMARGYLVALEERRKWRHRLAAYFVCMLGVMAVGIWLPVSEALWLRMRRTALNEAESLFLATRPGAGSVDQYLRRTAGQLMAHAERLERMAAFNPCECGAAALVMGIERGLPAGMELGQVTLDATGRRMAFTVLVPAERKILESEAPPNLIAQWSVDPLLAGRLTGVTAGKSERVSGGGLELLSWQFTGEIGGGR